VIPGRGIASGRLALVLALGCAVTAGAQTTTGSNRIYDVAINVTGEYTARTGPDHPGAVGQNVLYAGQSLTPNTSYNAVRSYDSRTDYVLELTPPSMSSGGFACRSINTVSARTVEAILTGPTRTGTRVIWAINNGVDLLTVRQEVNAQGTTFENSAIRVSICITNDGPVDAHVGVKYEWDWQIGGCPTCDGAFIGLRPPDPPLEPFEGVERDYPLPGFEFYDVCDSATPSITPCLYRVAGTVNGPVLTPPPIAPELVQYIQWQTAYDTCFTAATAGRTIGNNDSAVTYYWGASEGTALQLNPGETTCVTQYLFVFLVEPPPLCSLVASLQGGDACAPSTVTLDASGSNDPDCLAGLEYRFLDPFGNVVQDWSTDPTAEADATGTWSMDVRCSSNTNCDDSASTFVQVYAVDAQLAGGSACPPSAVTLDASASAAPGCSGPLEYRFLDPMGSVARDWDATATFDVTDAGTWTVEVRCQARPECWDGATADASFNATDARLQGGGACAPGSVVLDASASTAPGCTGALEYRFFDPSMNLARDWMADPTHPADVAGTWTVEVRCSTAIACSSTATADVTIGAPSARLLGGAGCDGPVTLDASSSTAPGCAGPLEFRFTDPLGNLAQDWSTTATLDAGEAGTWTADVRCSTDTSCVASTVADVLLETRPLPFLVGVRDVDPCNVGLLVSWTPEALPDWEGAAWGTNARGTFTVRRSEVSCADAAAQPPLATGLTLPRFVDLATQPGTTYWYHVTAEAALPAAACSPGPERGAPFRDSCTSASTLDEVSPPVPADIGALLRVTKPAGLPRLNWQTPPPPDPPDPLPLGLSDIVFRSVADASNLVPYATEVLSLQYEDQEPLIDGAYDVIFYEVFRANECGVLSLELD
jgi:hypothetical protein